MSRLIKRKISLSSDVSVSNVDGFFVVTSSRGSISVPASPSLVSLNVLDGGLKVSPISHDSTDVAGTVYVRTKNAVSDVQSGFSVKLKLVGVGFKVAFNQSSRLLRLFLGFSHDIVVLIPKNLSVTVSNDTNFEIFGLDRGVVMQFANEIRSLKKPEPYKGKGIFINDEVIKRKEGKKK